MESSLSWATYLLFGFTSVGLVVLQIVLFKRDRSAHPSSDAHFNSLFSAWLVSLGINALGCGLLHSESALQFAESFSVHAFGLSGFTYGYYHFLNLRRTARRARILTELLEAGGMLSETALVSRYGSREMLRLRVERMLETGQMVERNGTYHAARKGLFRSAQLVLFLKRVFLAR